VDEDKGTRLEAELEIFDANPIAVKRGDQTILVKGLPWEAAMRVAQKVFPLGKDVVELFARLQFLFKKGALAADVIDRELLERLCSDCPEAVRELVCGSCCIQDAGGEERELIPEEFAKLPYHAVPILIEHALRVNYFDNPQAKRFFTRLLTMIPKMETTPNVSDTS
jgi:hypothetical protein